MNVIGGLSSPAFLNISCNDIYKIAAKLYHVILIAVVCFFYLLYARKLFRKKCRSSDRLNLCMSSGHAFLFLLSFVKLS